MSPLPPRRRQPSTWRSWASGAGSRHSPPLAPPQVPAGTAPHRAPATPTTARAAAADRQSSWVQGAPCRERGGPHPRHRHRQRVATAAAPQGAHAGVDGLRNHPVSAWGRAPPKGHARYPSPRLYWRCGPTQAVAGCPRHRQAGGAREGGASRVAHPHHHHCPHRRRWHRRRIASEAGPTLAARGGSDTMARQPSPPWETAPS